MIVIKDFCIKPYKLIVKTRNSGLHIFPFNNYREAVDTYNYVLTSPCVEISFEKIWLVNYDVQQVLRVKTFEEVNFDEVGDVIEFVKERYAERGMDLGEELQRLFGGETDEEAN